jgi:predicted ATPase
MKYIFELYANLDFFSSVKELADHLNETMKQFGFSEKLAINGPIGNITMTTKKRLTPEELDKIVALMKVEYSKKLKDVKIIPKGGEIS